MMNDEWKQAAQAIANHLPWTLLDYGPRNGSLYMRGPHDVEVIVSCSYQDKSKLSFSVAPDKGLHEYEGWNPKRPHANISMNRDPSTAARDVNRRCLEPSVKYVLELREKKAVRDVEDDRKWKRLQHLADMLGGEVFTPCTNDGPMNSTAERGKYGTVTSKFKLQTGPYDFDTETHGDDTVSVELKYLSIDEATDLAKWLDKNLWKGDKNG